MELTTIEHADSADASDGSHSSTGPSATVQLSGRFDAFEVDEFRAAVEQLQAKGTNHIEVDLSDVGFIDSTGLAELVRGMKRCRTAGGDLKLVTPSDPVQVILELTRLDTAFDIAFDIAA